MTSVGREAVREPLASVGQTTNTRAGVLGRLSSGALGSGEDEPLGSSEERHTREPGVRESGCGRGTHFFSGKLGS